MNSFCANRAARPRLSARRIPLSICIPGQSDKRSYNVTVVTSKVRRGSAASPRRWLLLTTKVSPKPTARRVYIWRKLKRLGAILLHDAVWVLPDTPRTREQFQWMTAEVIEMGGEAFLWESRLILGTSEEVLAQKFVELVDAAYRSILKELAKKNHDLSVLSQQYQRIKQQDYFNSEAGTRVRQALISARGGKAR